MIVNRVLLRIYHLKFFNVLESNFFFLKKKKNSGSTWYDVYVTLTVNYFNSFNNVLSKTHNPIPKKNKKVHNIITYARYSTCNCTS